MTATDEDRDEARASHSAFTPNVVVVLVPLPLEARKGVPRVGPWPICSHAFELRVDPLSGEARSAYDGQRSPWKLLMDGEPWTLELSARRGASLTYEGRDVTEVYALQRPRPVWRQSRPTAATMPWILAADRPEERVSRLARAFVRASAAHWPETMHMVQTTRSYVEKALAEIRIQLRWRSCFARGFMQETGDMWPTSRPHMRRRALCSEAVADVLESVASADPLRRLRNDAADFVRKHRTGRQWGTEWLPAAGDKLAATLSATNLVAHHGLSTGILLLDQTGTLRAGPEFQAAAKSAEADLLRLAGGQNTVWRRKKDGLEVRIGHLDRNEDDELAVTGMPWPDTFGRRWVMLTEDDLTRRYEPAP